MRDSRDSDRTASSQKEEGLRRLLAASGTRAEEAEKAVEELRLEKEVPTRRHAPPACLATPTKGAGVNQRKWETLIRFRCNRVRACLSRMCVCLRECDRAHD